MNTTRIDRSSTSTSAQSTFEIDHISEKYANLDTNEIAEAVHDYIQILRKMGKTRVSSVDISEALGISNTLVQNAMTKLYEKGVKKVND